MRWRHRTKPTKDMLPGLFADDEGAITLVDEPHVDTNLDAIPDAQLTAKSLKSGKYVRDNCSIELGDSLSLCENWETPTMISVDGPYGVGGFDGDPYSPEELADWYEPHIAKWSKAATPQTTLCFWNTEIGWANVHPVLAKYGWQYRGASVWDKGIAHIAGNVNTGVLRKLPIVTELCVHYVKEATFDIDGRKAQMKEWLRHEWKRTGLPLTLTNEACGVKNAATRKYFTQCRLWYFPPTEVFEKFAAYANTHGNPEGRPYFSLDGKSTLTAKQWDAMRAKFDCEHGVTNV